MDSNVTIKNNSKSRRGFLLNLPKLIGGTALLAASANIFTSKEIKAASNPNSPLAGDSPFIGSIDMVGFNFAPRNWALCDGQLLPISQNTALFSLLGTQFGGNGITTFGLPDLRGRVPIHQGNGPGLTPRSIGERSGEESVTLLSSQMPIHNHTLGVNSSGGTSDNPTGNYMASNSEGIKQYSNSAGSNANSSSLGNAGGGQPHNNMPPSLCVIFIICLSGIFPSRN
jgi:microcystin-dependent protein